MRQTATYVSCDNPECSASVAVEHVNDTPEAWYVVILAGAAPVNGSTAQKKLEGGFTLCGLECLATWALERDAALLASSIKETKS